ncbi:hypothetical protein CC86DRAFT_378600 [Ophiobolus disseminans]|uniref:Uncharacterized protein n=1 Tax=Ophiobolus disseminans TaxID=1469910 RepID=A0A6A7AAH2_9PLEO|nr:hypothetical protein CC86DRAFT_378600 [Ophiobolus disseminans]
MHDYSKEVVIKLKNILRNVRLSFPATKTEMITMLEDWDKENAPRIAAHEPDRPKRAKRAQAIVQPSRAKTTTAAEQPSKRLKRKGNYETGPQSPKRQKTDCIPHALHEQLEYPFIKFGLNKFVYYPKEDVDAREEENAIETNTEASSAYRATQEDDTDTQAEYDGYDKAQKHKYRQKLLFNSRTGKARGILEEKDKSAPPRAITGDQEPPKGRSKKHTDAMFDEFVGRFQPNALAVEGGNSEEQAANSKRGLAQDHRVCTVARKTHRSMLESNPEDVKSLRRSKLQSPSDDTANVDRGERDDVHKLYEGFALDPTDDLVTNNTDETEVKYPASRSSSVRVASKSSNHPKSGKKGKKTEEDIEAEHAERVRLDAEKKRILHESLPLGAYTDLIVARIWRVRHRTIMLKMDNDVAPGKERAPMNQLGSWRWEERYMELEAAAGREVPLWMGGSSPVGQGWSDDLWDDDEDVIKI